MTRCFLCGGAKFIATRMTLRTVRDESGVERVPVGKARTRPCPICNKTDEAQGKAGDYEKQLEPRAPRNGTMEERLAAFYGFDSKE